MASDSPYIRAQCRKSYKKPDFWIWRQISASGAIIEIDFWVESFDLYGSAAACCCCLPTRPAQRRLLEKVTSLTPVLSSWPSFKELPELEVLPGVSPVDSGVCQSLEKGLFDLQLQVCQSRQAEACFWIPCRDFWLKAFFQPTLSGKARKAHYIWASRVIVLEGGPCLKLLILCFDILNRAWVT